MRKTLFAFLLTSLFSLPTFAEENFKYECEMKQFLQVEQHLVKNYELEKFTFTASPKEVVFEESFAAMPLPMDVDLFISKHGFMASYGTSATLKYNVVDFYFQTNNFGSIIVVTAKCDLP